MGAARVTLLGLLALASTCRRAHAEDGPSLPPPAAPLVLWPQPWLRDCGESTMVRPISKFCRPEMDKPGGFHEASLFTSSARALELRLEPPRVRVFAPKRGADQTAAHATVEATLRANVRGLQWEAYLTGPALLRAEVNEVGPGVYTIAAPVYDGGAYALELMLMWENASIAMSPLLGSRPRLDEFVSHKVKTPDADNFRRDAALCRPVRLEAGDAGAPPFATAAFNVPLAPRLPPTAECAPFGSARHLAGKGHADRGRWLNASAAAARARTVAAPTTEGMPSAAAPTKGMPSICELVWAPLDCALKPYPAKQIDKCVESGVRLVLQGDSHARMTFAAIAAASPSAQREWLYAGGMGLLQDNAGRRAWSSKTRSVGQAAAGAFNASAHAFATHFVFNAGSWDLVFVGAAEHTLDWAFFISPIMRELQRTAEAAAKGQGAKPPLLIWRTSPPHAVRFDGGHNADRRSNAKVEWVAGRQREYLDWLQRGVHAAAKRVHVHDTLAVELPRFHDNADTHHFLMPSLGGKRTSPWSCGAATALGSELNFSKLSVANCPLGPRAGTSVGIADAVVLLNSVCNSEP
jgi:hypothetical protein